MPKGGAAFAQPDTAAHAAAGAASALYRGRRSVCGAVHFARSAVLVLAALLAAPIPAVQTVIALGQQAAQAQQAASVQADPRRKAPRKRPLLPSRRRCMRSPAASRIILCRCWARTPAQRMRAVFLKRIIRRAAAKVHPLRGGKHQKQHPADGRGHCRGNCKSAALCH